MRDLGLLPKVHLHVHLESAVRESTLVELADRYGVVVPPRPVGFAGFREFADRGALVRGCLRSPEDFARVAVEFCADEAAAGVRYAEVTFTAASHGERLGAPGMPLAAVVAGLAEGSRRFGIEVRVVLDHSRRRSVERLRATVAEALRYPGVVVAVGVAGEESYPIEPFAPVLARAREAGLGMVHHAGEMCGAQSVRAAVRVGGAVRVGHGFRVLEDPEVVAEVRDRGVALEVCPSSNVVLGLVGSWAEHPLPRLREAGLVVTLNTDVPDVAGVSLTDEFARARAVFGWSDAVLAEVSAAAVGASFAPEGVKARVRGEIAAWLGAV